MARSGPSRSRRATQPLQPSQSQRSRPARDDEDDESNEEEVGEENEENDLDGDLRQDRGESEVSRKANDLVRLALSTEHKRAALRRDEINKKVLGSNTRSFTAVLEQAQMILRKTFGMELVELRSRAGLEQEDNANADGEERTGLKKKAAAAGSKTYILRSVLSATIIEQAGLTDADILEEEAVDMPEGDDDEEVYRTYGSIISWSHSDQLQAIGILYTILALILVNGKALDDLALRAYLKKLRLPQNASVNFTTISTHKSLSIDSYLTQLIRQGYLDRHRVGDNAQKKRGRAAQTQGEEGAAYEWRWGTRAQSEVGELGVARFVAEFMIERMMEEEAEDSEEEGDERAAKKRAEENRKKVEAMMKAIQRESNGTLSDVK
ncbi:MAGE-domain-containing protein [Heliocybe sulcata]|uniref:MAGE-domain-containing protein n=1 Tax=Heliocybe sulcata TaxID=5364 RepID=A0A5C3NBQ1_9AGAM|nr:MAGE-domain-containing protein [Heliocybe sulcata]